MPEPFLEENPLLNAGLDGFPQWTVNFLYISDSMDIGASAA